MKIFYIIKYNSNYSDVSENVESLLKSLNHDITSHIDLLKIGDGEIIEDYIGDEIKKSDMVIADTSVYEGNVVSELALAKAFKKPIIIISNEDGYRYLSKYYTITYDRLRIGDTLISPLENYFLKHKTKSLVVKSIKTNLSEIKTIFVSYSHIDESFISRLNIHLKPFIRNGQIDLWIDTKIKAGDKWELEIEKALNKSAMAILLISADFLASDFIIDNELPPLLKEAEENGKRIIPIIVKPCRYTSTPTLNKFQSLNDPKKPLSKMDDNEREEIYVKLADLIDGILN